LTDYPPSKRVEHVDTYHGVEIADPYRWLEDLDATDTAEWVAAQHAVAMPYLDALPQRDPIRRRLTELWDHERVSAPFHRGDRWFVLANDGLQNQSVVYALDGPTADARRRVVLDPNAWDPNGTISLAGFVLDDDATHAAYGVSTAGSDWTEWRVLEVDTGEDTGDVLRWAKFTSAEWLPDGSGFFYGRYPEPTGDAMEDSNFFQQLHLHRLGTPQSDDVLVYERKDHKDWLFSATVTEDGEHLLLHVEVGTDPRNGVFHRRLADRDAPFTELLADFDALYHVLGNDGDRLYLRTDKDAPMGRVVALDLDRPGVLVELVPEDDAALEAASIVGDQLFLSYLVDARSEVRVHALDGTFVRTVDLPGPGTTVGFGGRRRDQATYFQFVSFTDPGSVYRYDLATGETTLWYRPEVAFDPDGFVTTQVFVPSKDGTRVPAFITHLADLDRGVPQPAYLYGYGGFNISMTPAFSVANIAWLEMGGVYVHACLRGGNEYGEAWHLAGTKARKQNVFDDFIAIAEWLIAERWTTSEQLVIAGGSNGGLLVGACMTQRPDLFAVALPSRGVLDMLRFERFTIGWAWASDYGTVDDPDDFAALRAYSPLHSLREGVSYPATLITTADHDDRVVPSHSFKFAAELQRCQAVDGPPVLIRIETDAGHGAGASTTKLIEEGSDVRAFVADRLGMTCPWE
jgi:prolyl oligopeptidase